MGIEKNTGRLFENPVYIIYLYLPTRMKMSSRQTATAL